MSPTFLKLFHLLINGTTKCQKKIRSYFHTLNVLINFNEIQKIIYEINNVNKGRIVKRDNMTEQNCVI